MKELDRKKPGNDVRLVAVVVNRAEDNLLIQILLFLQERRTPLREFKESSSEEWNGR